MLINNPVKISNASSGEEGGDLISGIIEFKLYKSNSYNNSIVYFSVQRFKK